MTHGERGRRIFPYSGAGRRNRNPAARIYRKFQLTHKQSARMAPPLRGEFPASTFVYLGSN